MAINEPEFIQDMIFGDWKVWGSTLWNPKGWEVGPELVVFNRWWDYAYNELLERPKRRRNFGADSSIINNVRMQCSII
jgi:hypothetical protein